MGKEGEKKVTLGVATAARAVRVVGTFAPPGGEEQVVGERLLLAPDTAVTCPR